MNRVTVKNSHLSRNLQTDEQFKISSLKRTQYANRVLSKVLMIIHLLCNPGLPQQVKRLRFKMNNIDEHVIRIVDLAYHMFKY